MTTEHDVSREALRAFATSFAVERDASLVSADRLTLEDVRRFLIPQITALLDRNPNLLMHILYRVDVAERDVQRVFAESASQDIPAHLADLLIERQLLKLEIRRRYRD